MSEIETLPKFPPEIAKAIIGVMSEIEKLAKEEKNTHGGYKFASIDAFLELVNPLCAKHKIFFWINEREVETIPPQDSVDKYGKPKKTPPALNIKYDIYIVHETGIQCGPAQREVTVLANGAQAYGSAQSYVLKQFQRGLFQIPTGDRDDPDFAPAETLPQKKTLPKKDARALFTELSEGMAELEGLGTQPLVDYLNTKTADIESLPQDWQSQFNTAAQEAWQKENDREAKEKS